jgi:hypothetical protein
MVSQYQKPGRLKNKEYRQNLNLNLNQRPPSISKAKVKTKSFFAMQLSV